MRQMLKMLAKNMFHVMGCISTLTGFFSDPLNAIGEAMNRDGEL